MIFHTPIIHRKFVFPVILIFLMLLNFELPAQSSGTIGLRKRPTVGLVLSGGGAKGFAYIGLLKVIQEAGLPIDYIGGSSIGSIIGGLYAVGYHPDSIEKMIRTQKWGDLLKDVTARKYIDYEEKEYREKTIVTLPIKGKKITLNPSMYGGQEIDLLLNYYFSPAFKIMDFHKLQTPFLCIGTNLYTGAAVILDSGYLPMAIRSSMSIPGYFSPTDYLGNYLVDGGVVNNYPVKEVKEMGAQIIIGGDVQHGLYSTREQLNSITSILEQIIAFYRTRANEIGDSLTDLKILFKMDYGIMDFERYDSIIALGERVARAHFTEIKALADSLNAIEYQPLKKFEAHPIDTILVDNIIIKGNKKISDHYFSSFFQEAKNNKISLNNLQNDIRLIYGSGFFESVSYEFENENNKTNLIINVKEGGLGYLSAGIHFDNDYSGSLILGGIFRNILGRNTKLFADLNLGLSPRLKVTYLLGLNGKTDLGASAEFFSFKFDVYDKDVKINKIVFTNNKASLFFNYSFRNRLNFKTGFDYEYFRYRQDIKTDTILDDFQEFSSYGTIFIELNADTRDRINFPTTGCLAALRGEYVMPLSNNWASKLFSNSFVLYLSYDQNISLSRRFVLQPGLFGGALIRSDDSPPPQHFFALGGSCPSNYVDPYRSFTGLHFFQEFGYYTAVGRLKLQYNLYRKLFLSLKTDIGAITADAEDLFNSENFLCGYGLTAGYDSLIGPIELSIMGSNINSDPLFFVNIGFWF
ncbi:MAG: patatin-like phospholipase family protein [Bacteroidales bacterium]|nr:patatin-like phospholipase family protein [Bacteroidales bacterium]